MKKLLVFMLLIPLMAGCSGVWMNAEYSQLLDKTVALSDGTATYAEAGKLTPEQMTAALRRQAETWRLFQQARDGEADE